MTFNILVGGAGRGQPLERTVDVIRAADPDTVGMQEALTHAGGNGTETDSGAKVAAMLGWTWVPQDGGTGILTKLPVLATTPRKCGVKVGLPAGGHAWHFNVHLPHAPYQPYQLLKIPYADAPFIRTGAEALRAANEARGEVMAGCLQEAANPMHEGVPVFLTGDFNEPSHLDWTPAAVAAGRCPLPVPWPATGAAALAGFTDAWRAVHPDPVAAPGFTWTPLTTEDDPADHHDRIDFVMAARVKAITGVRIVGEHVRRADVVVDPYPSDHRAVVAEFVLAR